MIKESKIKTLVLFAHYTDKVSYYDDWADAFSDALEFNVSRLNLYDLDSLDALKKTISDFELIICLHSTNAAGFKFLFPYISVLNKRRCQLMLFFGNELNYPILGMRMQDKLHLLSVIKPDFVASQLPKESAIDLYQDSTNAEIIELPHALNPKCFNPKIEQRDRTIDIGVRSERYLPFMGNNDRNEIIDFFESYQFHSSFNLDIGRAWKDRFSRDGWANFLNNCKGTIATEAGSDFLEKDDQTVIAISEYVENRSETKNQFLANRFRRVNSRYRKYLPYKTIVQMEDYLAARKWIDNKTSYDHYYTIGFDEIFDRFYRNYENARSGKCISSRHFDAIGCKTCQIMFPGHFNGILEAGKHYISLSKDFSNISDVMAAFNDDKTRQEIVDRAYDHVFENHTYRNRMNSLLSVVDHC